VLSATVANAGTAEATGVVVRFTDGDKLIGNSVPVDAAEGATKTVSVTWETRAPIAVTAGSTYGLAATVAGQQASSAPRIGVQYLDGAGAVVGTVDSLAAGRTGDFAPATWWVR